MINEMQSAGDGGKAAPLPRLKKVCNEFEALFLSHMLKTMRSSMCGDGVFGKSQQGEILGSMTDEKMALDIAKKRGIGLGELLFRKLQAAYHPSNPGKNDGT